MGKSSRIAFVMGTVLMFASSAEALVVCARDNGFGQPREKSKLVLKSACTPGKEVAIGIAVTGEVGVDSNVQFYGTNVQVVSGSGTTGGTVNGLGNLVVGYNEATGGQVRNGSHNISVGIQNEYTSFGGLVAGSYNTVSGPYASVSGGIDNTASGDSAAISGGTSSTASGLYASVTGGYGNTASEESSTVSGGGTNTASGLGASVSGGTLVIASGVYSSVVGGTNNEAGGDYSSVSGGKFNTASGEYSAVSGGSVGTASGDYASVGGGLTVTAAGTYDWHAGQSLGFPNGSEY